VDLSRLRCTTSFAWHRRDCAQTLRIDLDVGACQMLVALEINVALWGMIGCAGMEIAQFFQLVF
jgi:hypothetical protein